MKIYSFFTMIHHKLPWRFWLCFPCGLFLDFHKLVFWLCQHCFDFLMHCYPICFDLHYISIYIVLFLIQRFRNRAFTTLIWFFIFFMVPIPIFTFLTPYLFSITIDIRSPFKIASRITIQYIIFFYFLLFLRRYFIRTEFLLFFLFVSFLFCFFIFGFTSFFRTLAIILFIIIFIFYFIF